MNFMFKPFEFALKLLIQMRILLKWYGKLNGARARTWVYPFTITSAKIHFFSCKWRSKFEKKKLKFNFIHSDVDYYRLWREYHVGIWHLWNTASDLLANLVLFMFFLIYSNYLCSSIKFNSMGSGRTQRTKNNKNKRDYCAVRPLWSIRHTVNAVRIMNRSSWQLRRCGFSYSFFLSSVVAAAAAAAALCAVSCRYLTF